MQAAYEVPENFHSRRRAASRTYRYSVLNRDFPSPLRRRHCYWVDGDLNVAAMAGAARSLVGRHDFRAFSPGCPPEKNTVRLVSRWDVWREDYAVYFECEANGFLIHQIRCANGLLLEVGKGRRPPSIVGDVLAGLAPAGATWPSLPARGLCLMEVTYPEFPPALHDAAGEDSWSAGGSPAREIYHRSLTG